MRILIALALGILTIPSLAQSSKTRDATGAAGSPQAVLDGLLGTKQIIGITKRDGTRYLGRMAGGDHGLYLVQEFHFAGPPRITTQTLPPTQGRPVAHHRWVTVGSGKKRGRYQATTYTPGRVMPGRRIQVVTPTTMPDDQAVRLLLAGAAGSITNPDEVQGRRDMFSPSDVNVIQALSPPQRK